MAKRIEHCVVLYVEDDDATVYLFQMAFREVGAGPQIFRTTTGDQAIAFLTHSYPYEDAPRPDLVILDVNPSGLNGFEVLRFMNEDPALKRIPVFVFSTSSDPHDRAEAIAAGARGYLTKDGSVDTFVEVAKTICSELKICSRSS